ncbi:hypothetical protein NUU61_007716 [Penicillium alfredii]|uniref:Phosphatidylinositol-specific phospholipase C X domain-containing protein n=1 Tax=Penicillium alfredii TaxID=1506179 RepID=A0A9W9ERC7_9EURO|nr:uncharacterized protein NUU61_007716 [Penicillium alfredii]KAJ5086409.1 hypothetical protein NUU61_007716 [Penicillium alfredii]
MRWPTLVFALLAGVVAEETTTENEISLGSGTVVTTPKTVPLPSGSYQTVSTTLSLDDGDSSVTVTTETPVSGHHSNDSTTTSSSSESVTVLVGGGGSTTIGNSSMANVTATRTTSSTPSPINTQPCNNYPEFCTRRYSNITMVAAHNSPFVRSSNVAANQALDVIAQLNDGVRMLQFQTHYENDTVQLCHTSCQLLNVGTLESYLTKVAEWMRENPFEVVTLMIGNFDLVSVSKFKDPIEKSGLKDLVYKPPKAPMGLHDWPTLSEMIISGKRVVVFMDYQADQKKIPWIIDEFSQMWESPFSPTNPNFPCDVQRPPGLSDQDAKKRMYLVNHNLNLELNLGALSLLIPNTAQISQTNAVNGTGSLGWMAGNCSERFDRPPNFLLVDYYNMGSADGKGVYNGSVFDVAAKMNNVTYNRDCCGKESAASHGASMVNLTTVLLLVMGVQWVMSVF